MGGIFVEKYQIDAFFGNLLDELGKPSMVLDWMGNPIAVNRKMEMLAGVSLTQMQYLHKIHCFSLKFQAKYRYKGFYELVIYQKTFRLQGKMIAECEDYQAYLFEGVEAAAPEEEKPIAFDTLTGTSTAFLNVVNACKDASQPNTAVLLTGESGTGKEVLARCMHREGSFREGMFYIIKNNQEFYSFVSELPELAGSTVYIDEFSNFNHYNQDVLMEMVRDCFSGEYKLICASSTNLNYLVMRGELHRNLFYALQMQRIDVPSLRQRAEDIPLLADLFMERLNRKFNRGLVLSEQTRQQLAKLDWPGNLNELESFLTRCIRISEAIEGELPLEDIQKILAERRAEAQEEDFSLTKAEHELIMRALSIYGDSRGSKRECAKALGISLATLYRKMAQYGIQSKQFYED